MELLKHYDISVLYHSSKVDMVVDDLSRIKIGSVLMYRKPRKT